MERTAPIDDSLAVGVQMDRIDVKRTPSSNASLGFVGLRVTWYDNGKAMNYTDYELQEGDSVRFNTLVEFSMAPE